MEKKHFKLRYIQKTCKYEPGDFHRCFTDNHDTVFGKQGKSLYCAVCKNRHVFFLDPTKNNEAEKVYVEYPVKL